MVRGGSSLAEGLRKHMIISKYQSPMAILRLMQQRVFDKHDLEVRLS